MVILGGLFAPLLIALLLLVGGGHLMKEISILIIGFNLIISYKDFLELGVSENVTIFAVIIGCILVVLGVGFLSMFRTEENTKIKPRENL